MLNKNAIYCSWGRAWGAEQSATKYRGLKLLLEQFRWTTGEENWALGQKYKHKLREQILLSRMFWDFTVFKTGKRSLDMLPCMLETGQIHEIFACLLQDSLLPPPSHSSGWKLHGNHVTRCLPNHSRPFMLLTQFETYRVNRAWAILHLLLHPVSALEKHRWVCKVNQNGHFSVWMTFMQILKVRDCIAQNN